MQREDRGIWMYMIKVHFYVFFMNTYIYEDIFLELLKALFLNQVMHLQAKAKVLVLLLLEAHGSSFLY